MAVLLRFLFCAIFASLASAQVSVSVGSSAISVGVSVPAVSSSSSSPSPTITTTSSASPSAQTTSSVRTTSSVVTTPSVATTPSTTSVQASSSIISSAPPASTTASSSPSNTSTTPSGSPSPATTSIVTTSPPAKASSVPSTSTETSPVAPRSSTTIASPSTSSSQVSPPPASSTTASRSSASSTSNALSSFPEPQSTLSSSSSSARSRTESSSSKSAESSAYIYSSVSSSVVPSTVFSTSAVVITTQGDNGQLTQRTSYAVVATTVPGQTLYATTVVTSTESPTGIAGLQAQALGGGGGGGLSTGAKAGIGAGVAILIVAASILGALFAMRRRRKNKNNRISEGDRYPPSSNPSLFGAAAFGKTKSRYAESEQQGSSHSPPMRENDPLDRYATPGVVSQRTTLPPNSRTSDISSVSGSEPTTYRPGPGMPAVAEYNNRQRIEELPEQTRMRSSADYVSPSGYSEVAGNPFHEKHGGNDSSSEYSDDGNGGPRRYPSQRQASPAALELSGENTLASSTSNASGGYRGMDPEQPYHTRSQLTKPSLQQRQFDPSHNF